MTVAATIFAGLGAAATLVTALVALSINKSTAGRAMVLLKLAGFDPMRGALATTEEGKFRRTRNGAPVMELAQVVVENPGRSPVTIRKVSLRLKGTSSRRRTVTPRVFELENMWSGSAVTETYKRLGAYDHTTYLMDFWSVVDNEFSKDPTLHKMTMLAEVEIAGYRKVFRSKAKWVFYAGTLSALRDQRQRHTEDIALTELVRAYAWDHDRGVHSLNELFDLGYVAKNLASTISSSCSQLEIENAVVEALESSSDASKERPQYRSSRVSFGITKQLERVQKWFDMD